jgi:type IV pilus assembly protein PilM
MSRRVVGIDVTAKSIRAVQMLHRKGQRSVVEKFIEHPYTAVASASELNRGQYLAGQLKLVWAAAGFRTKDVVIGVGGPDVFVKEFVAPDLPKAKLKKELPELVNSELPMAVEDVVLDYYANRRFEVDGESKLGGLVVAANRQTIDDYIEAARSAKLNVLSIDLIPFALTRNLAKREAQTGVRAYVRATNGYINIVVTDGPAITFMRLVPWDLQAINRTPLSKDEDSEGVGISLEFTDVSTSQIEAVDGEDETLRSLQRQAVRELNDTILYFQRNHPEKPIQEILVSGYRLDNPGFLTAIKDGRDVKVSGVTRTGLGHKRSTVTKVNDADLPDHLAVALALAEVAAL